MIAMIGIFIIAFVSFRSSSFVAFANEVEFTNGELNTDKLSAGWTTGLLSGATIKLEGSQLMESNDANPLSLYKALAGSTNVNFSDPQLQNAIRNRRLKVDIEISGTNKIEILENGVWTQNFGISSVLESNVKSEFKIPSHNVTRNLSNLEGNFENYKIVSDLLLNNALMLENSLKIEVSSSASAIKEPSMPGNHETGVKILTSITSIVFKLKFEKLKVNIAVAGVDLGAGKILFQDQTYNVPTGQSIPFEIDFIFAQRDPDFFDNILNKPIFEAQKGVSDDREYLFIGWTSLSGHVGGGDFKQKYLYSNFLEEVQTGVTVYYRATYRLITFQNNYEEIAYRPTNPLLPALFVQPSDKSATSFHVGLIETYEDLEDGTLYGQGQEAGLKPTKVGEYKYEVQVTLGSPSAGGGYPDNKISIILTKLFTIVKANPELKFSIFLGGEEVILTSANSAEMYFGKSLSSLNLQRSATYLGAVLAGGVFNFVRSASGSADIVSADDVFIRPDTMEPDVKVSTLGQNRQYVRYVPADTENYNTVYGYFNLNIVDGMSLVVLNNDAGELIPKRTAEFSFTYTDEIDTTVVNNLEEGATLTNGVLKLSININFEDTSGNYFFLGVSQVEYGVDRKFFRNSGGSNQSFDYYFKDVKTTENLDVEKEVRGQFEVNFIRDITAHLGVEEPDDYNEYVMDYTGNQGSIEVRYSNESMVGAFISNDAPAYYVNGTGDPQANLPIAVGTHEAKYKIYLTLSPSPDDTFEVGERTLSIKVNRANIVSTQEHVENKNPDTGFSSSEIVGLIANNVGTGGLTKYYYSDDEKATFNEITGTIQNATGCKIQFTPAVTPDTSRIKIYYFIAVHATYGETQNYGGTEYKVVAESKIAYTSKLDQKTPSNVTLTPLGAHQWGQWTNSNFAIRVTLDHGDSGIKVLYKEGASGTYKDASGLVGGNLGGTGKEYDIYINVPQNTFLDKDLYFKIQSGTKVEKTLDDAYNVKVDKSIPTCVVRTDIPNKWYKSDVQVCFSLNELGSGITTSNVFITGSHDAASILIENNILKFNTTNEGASMQYQVYVKDNAGNESAKQNFTINIDKTDLSTTISADDFEGWYYDDGNNREVYNPGAGSTKNWINKNLQFDFNLLGGTSKLKVQYKKAEGEWMDFMTSFEGNLDIYTGKNSLSKTFPLTTAPAGESSTYSFRIINEVFQYMVSPSDKLGTFVEFSYGRIDIDKTPLNISLPSGTDVWSASPINMEMTVEQPENSLYRSGILNVWYDFGKFPDIEDINTPKATAGEGNKFTFTVTSSLPLYVKAVDVAGNITEINTLSELNKYKVDGVNFGSENISFEGYKGGGNPNNEYDQTVVPSTVYNFGQHEWSNEYVRLLFRVNKIPASGIFIYQTSVISSDVLIASIYAQDESEIGDVDPNYNPGHYNQGKIVVSKYYMDAMSINVGFVLKTGAGFEYVIKAKGTAYVNIDKTNPTIMEVSKTSNGVSFDFTTNWTSSNSRMDLSFIDDLSKVNQIYLFKKDVTAPDTSFVNVTSVELKNHETNESLKFIDFEGYYSYRIMVIDKAGNEAIKDFTSMIDKFDAFEISEFESVIKKEGEPDTPYADRWLEEDESISLKLKYAYLSGATAFGPSGLYVDFMRQGFANYSRALLINGTEQKFNIDEPAKTFEMLISESQVQTYTRLRLTTGAGVYKELSINIKAKKDIEVVNFNVTGNIVGDTVSYTGAWTNKDVDIKLALSSGPSAKSIYIAFADEFAEGLNWVEIGTISSATQNFTYRANVTQNKKAFFKLESLHVPSKATYYNTGFTVKIDKNNISPQIVGVVDGDVSYLSGQWTNKEVILSFSKSEGSISPITSIQIREDNVPSTWTDINDTKTVSLPAAGTLRQKRFSIIVTNATGKQEESTIFNVWQSLVTPFYQYSVAPEFANQPMVDGWYLTRAAITLTVANPGNVDFYSGYKYYVRKKAPEASEYGEWQPITLVSSKFYISDLNAQGAKGGSDFKYSIKVEAPNGLNKIYEDEPALHIKIDQAIYVASITQSVSGIQGTAYSTLTNNVFSVRRGASVPFISVTPKPNYFYKSITYNYGDPNVVNQTFEKADEEKGTKEIGKIGTDMTFKITGEDVILNIEYYRLLPISIINPERHIQDGSNLQETRFETTDLDFISVFGPLKLVGETYEGPCIRIETKYFDENENDLSELPTEIGSYYISFEHAFEGASDFIIDSAKKGIKVNYFAGKGTYASPYLINNVNDFYSIGLYMKYKEDYDTYDPYNYLNPVGGAIRYNAYFRQTQNLLFPVGLFPELGKFLNAEGTDLVSDGSGASFVFKGVYDGDGFELGYRNVLLIQDESYGGFFTELDGAKIRNVRINLNVSISQDIINYGHIAAKAKDSMVIYSYAIGQININNVESNVGSLIGYAESSLIANSVVDVVINKVSGTGSVGGIIGKSKDSYMINTYFAGQILAENILNLAEEGATSPENYIGGLIGYQEFNMPTIIKIENFIRKFSTSINGQVQSGLSTGNDYSLSTDKRLDFSEKSIDELMIDTTQIIRSLASFRSKSVAELILYRIVQLKESLELVGDGTSGSPLIIDSASKLHIVSLIPWAYYRQTRNLDLDLYALSESGGEYASLLTSSSFVGGYDGGNFTLNLSGILTSKSTYLGLFNILGGKVRNLTIKGLNLRSINTGQVIIGGITGLMLPGAEISNVHIGGIITVEEAEDAIAGSVVGIADNGKINNVVSAIAINILSSKRSLIGGLVAEVRGATNMSSIIFTSNLNINSTVASKFGRFIGRGLSGAIEVGAIRLINDDLYVNNVRKKENKGTLFDSAVHEEFLSLTETSRERVKTTTTIFAIGEYSMTMERHLARISNFGLTQGLGTAENPYQIKNYKDLLAIANNMNAYFVLANDITIGDYDGDGVIDDSYNNDFNSLGSQKPFNGYLNGNNKRINNLTAPLFNINAGSVFNLQLDVNYVLETDDDNLILFGAVAKENYSTGYIIGVTVSGIISIFAPNATVVAGSIVGKNYGLEVKANTVNIEVLNIFANQTIMGGIMGIATEDRVSLLLASANRFVTVSYAVANGSYVSAGYLIGLLEVALEAPPEAGPLDAGIIYKNGTQLDNRLYRIGNYPAEESPSSP